jgi:hypothetical protein
MSEQQLYKVTGLTSEKLTLLLRSYKNARLTNDHTFCFVNILATQEPALTAWCREHEVGLFSRYAGWRQLVP